jgi:hypothetical protein
MVWSLHSVVRVVASCLLVVASASQVCLAEPAGSPSQEPAGATQSQNKAPEPRQPFHLFELSTTPMWRNAMLSDLGWGLFERGVDWGLDTVTRDRFTRRSGAGVAARIGRWAALDVPMAWYIFVWAHEYGHKTRVNEVGLPARVIVAGSPWTGLNASTELPLPARQATLGMFSAGIEATTVIARRVERRMFVSGNARYEDLSALFVTTGMGFGHIQASLSAGRVEQSGIFQGPEFSDPVGYAVTLADRRFGTPTRDQIRDLANGIRSGSWMNLVDYGLVTLGVGLFRDYLVRGERQTPVRWIAVGGASFVPSLRYELTPTGPERQVRSFVKVGLTTSAVYARWSEPTDAARLVGAGGELHWPPLARWQPSGALDVWKNPDDELGLRAEGAIAWRRSAARLWRITAAVGGKRRGYVLGFPDAGGAYLSVGFGTHF